jgi:dipeptidyl aminopeptidase/acylaminoacyl peptidase
VNPNNRYGSTARRLALLILLSSQLLFVPQGAEAEPLHYKMPAPEIVRILDAPSRPLVVLNPPRTKIALLDRPAMPSISEVAQPDLSLGGLIVNPRNNGPGDTTSYSGLSFQGLAGEPARRVPLPAGTRLTTPVWSPNGRYLAFLLLRDEDVQLWVADTASGRARRLAAHVNAAFPLPFDWLPDSSGAVVRLIPAARGVPPKPDPIPSGPIVEVSTGEPERADTLQNLLSSPHDEALFKYYATSRLAVAKLDGSRVPIPGSTEITASIAVSPDGRYLLQRRVLQPFSYSVGASDFPGEYVVSDFRGRTLFRLTLAGADAGAGSERPRLVAWRADSPSTLTWMRTDSGGSDRLFGLGAPFAGEPRIFLEREGRFGPVSWGLDDLALITLRTPVGQEELLAFDPARAGTARVVGPAHRSRILLTWPNGYGGEVLHPAPGGRGVFVRSGNSASVLDIATGEVRPLANSGDGGSLIALLDRAGTKRLIRRATETGPPNLFVSDVSGPAVRQITHFTDPAPQLAGMQHRTLVYKRADGVNLSGTLHLPAGYDPAHDGPLPVLIWGYPVSVYSPPAAAEGRRDSRRFVRPHGFEDLPLLLVTQGYAVFEPTMPIVGGEGVEPNDTYIPQLIANAKAAIDVLVDAGVADRNRIAIGGWSYGAGMAANLLARTNLFRAGIALSGAYNRTLTPFGFQASERRTFWQAPEAYLDMSPFIHADGITEPLLLIHGTADSNSGTYPEQSERLFEALKTMGTPARLVLLPNEGHAYHARESVMHTIWEIQHWLDRYSRGKGN